MQKHCTNVIIKSRQITKTKECFCMINYSRLGYEIKRDLSKFSEKISKGLTKPKSKFVAQMLYGILAGNKVHLSEIARSLYEEITLKKTIERLSRNLFKFNEKDILMENYIAEVKKQIDEEQAVIVIDNSDITKPCSPKMEAISEVVPEKSEKDILQWRLLFFQKIKRCQCQYMKRCFLLRRMDLSV